MMEGTRRLQARSNTAPWAFCVTWWQVPSSLTIDAEAVDAAHTQGLQIIRMLAVLWHYTVMQYRRGSDIDNINIDEIDQIAGDSGAGE